METKRTKLLYKASIVGLKRDLVEPWVNRITPLEFSQSYDLISDFICLRSRLLSPVFRKNAPKFFKHLGFVKEAIEELLPLTRKFKHLSLLQVALNFARSRFLRRRTARCQTDPNTWVPFTLEPRVYINEQGVEESERPVQIHVYNCATFAAITDSLAKLNTIAHKEKRKVLYHGTTWTHAQSAAKGINIDCALPHSEFSVNGAFYLTDDWHQAHLHAMSKTTIIGHDDPAVVIYTVPEDTFTKRADHLMLQEDPHLWQTIVERCRNPNDTNWIERWAAFTSEYQSIEGPMPGEHVPGEDPIPKRNTWQFAVIGDASAKRMDRCIIGVVVWGDAPLVTAQPAAGQVASQVVHEEKNHVTEVIDLDVDMNISPITTPVKKIAVS
jgi:hypothetical protein